MKRLSWQHAPAVVAFLFTLILALASCSHAALEWTQPADLEVSDKGDWIAMQSSLVPSTGRGIMFYPGALVAPEAYLPVLAPFAQAGYQVVVVRFPMDLAVFDPERGTRLARGFGGSWVIGGHSLGGVMAANTVHTNPGVFKGLFFFASWPASGDDLSAWTGSVLSISGSNDGLSTPAEIDANKHLLPPGTQYVQINGANHAQFGDYGLQNGDNAASISPQDQWAAIQAAMSPWLGTLTW